MIKINLVSTLILCNLLVLFYLIIADVFTILLRINGVSVDKSRFQVISLITGTGFTTKESESLLITKRRRKLTQNIMLFSNAFNIVIVSTLVNLLISTSKTNIYEIRIGLILTALNLFLIFIVRKSNIVLKFIDRLILKISNSEIMKRGAIITVFDTYGNEVIAEVELKNIKVGIKNKTLKTLQLKDRYGVQILMIKRDDEIIENVNGNNVLKENDVLVVFGQLKNIKKAFIRREKKHV